MEREASATTSDGNWMVTIKAFRNTLAIYQEIGAEMKTYQFRKGKWRKTKVKSIGLTADFIGPSVAVDAGRWVTHQRFNPEPDDNENEVAIKKGGATIYEYSTDGTDTKMIIKRVEAEGWAEIDGYPRLSVSRVAAGDTPDGKI